MHFEVVAVFQMNFVQKNRKWVIFGNDILAECPSPGLQLRVLGLYSVTSAGPVTSLNFFFFFSITNASMLDLGGVVSKLYEGDVFRSLGNYLYHSHLFTYCTRCQNITSIQVM